MTTDSKSEKPTVTASTRMGDAIRNDPDLPMILMRFHIGGCSMCGFEQDDTVEDVAEANGVPLQELLAALNRTGG
ncbi:MAG: disulfide oxidoreductase [Planctomycetota bacterium]|nr:disulfide oxidoreductase [Planctomycetota bacterium]MDA0932074.1 disulfide oxidoreductase [Planctomycetota bacterium]